MTSEEEYARAVVFVRHIEKHLIEMGEFTPDAKVICKICDKTIDEIYEEERA